MKDRIKRIPLTALLVSCLCTVLSACGGGATDTASDGEAAITNVSYDPTRELYAAYNEAFISHYEEETGKKVSVIQSHGGSGGAYGRE